MKTRYRIMSRGSRGGNFYCVDTLTRKRTSLKTLDEDKARQIIEAKNLAERQPEINLQIAKAYLGAADQAFISRTWRTVMEEFVQRKPVAEGAVRGGTGFMGRGSLRRLKA